MKSLLSAAAVTLLLGALMAWFIAGETPTGTVEGVVVMKENNRPLEGVEVTLTGSTTYWEKTPSKKRPSDRRATTDAKGHFSIARVPVGDYKFFATAEHHSGMGSIVHVREGETAASRIAIVRQGPSLDLGTFQKVWGVAETPRVPVRGFVDPARDMAGDTLTLRVWRTRLSTILGDSEAADALTRLGSRYGEDARTGLPEKLLHPTNAANAPRLVSTTETVIRSTDVEGFFNERLPIKTSGPGVYLVEVSHSDPKSKTGKAVVSSSVLCTDMALVVKRAPGQVLSYAVGMNSGKPLAQATIRHYQSGKLVRSGTTDANGLADLAIPLPPRPNTGEEGGDSEGGSQSVPTLTVAVHGDDEAAIGKNAWFSSEDAGQFAVHAYTDRTVYRPGHTVHYKVIARRKTPGSTGRYTVPNGEAVTVEVRDPQGGRLLREVKTTNRWGTLDGTFDLSSEAPTGSYSLVTTLRGGEKHTADIAVASYRKPEFAVTITPKAKSFVQGDTITAVVEAKYYFGSPVAGAKLRYNVYRAPDWSRFYAEPDDDLSDMGGDEEAPPGYDGGNYYGDMVVDGEATLDENGRAIITIPTERARRTEEQEKGKNADDTDLTLDYDYTISATVEDEQAKRTVDADTHVAVTAGAFTLAVAPEGYAATPGARHSVVVRAQNADNKPVPNVEVFVAPTYERWNTKTGESKSDALPRIKAKTGPDGTAVITLTPPRAGSLSLTATAYDDKGRVLHARSELWVVSDRGDDLNTEYADLALLTDRRRYEPGQTARILINAARTGQTALLTVEGEKVYRRLLVPLTKRSTVVQLPVEAGWGPNVSLGVCYVRDKKFASSDHPLYVRLTEKTLNVSVTPDRAKYRPGDKATYTVKVADAAGRPVRGEVSLTVVDEAIYALRADDPTALRNAFYPHRYSRVQTDYSFEIAYMGDGDKSEPVIEMRRKFLDTAYWAPHLETDSSGQARVTVDLPDNLTTWRATVLACDDETSVGRATVKAVVSKPFFVRLDAPRFLTQTDDGQLLALIHNETDRPQTVHVRLTAPGLVTNNEVRKDLNVAAGQIGQVPVPVKAATIGDVTIKLAAYTDDKDERTGKPFTDGVENTLTVRVWAREKFTAFAGTLDGGGANSSAAVSEGTRTFVLDPATVLPETRLIVRVTPSVRAALVPALEYLVGFPYGCTEQTMSRFLPDVLVSRLQKDTGQTLLTGETGAKRAARLPRMVRDGVTRLQRFQHSESGGWGWWENDSDDAFMTAYVLYGLTEARDAGYAVPEGMWESARKAARTLATTFDKAKPLTDEDRIFLLYALAEAGDNEAAPTLRSILEEARSSSGLR